MKNSILDFRTLLSIGQDKYTGKVGKEVKKIKAVKISYISPEIHLC